MTTFCLVLCHISGDSSLNLNHWLCSGLLISNVFLAGKLQRKILRERRKAKKTKMAVNYRLLQKAEFGLVSWGWHLCAGTEEWRWQRWWREKNISHVSFGVRVDVYMLESLYCNARREFLDASYRSWSMCSCSECCVFLRVVQNQHQLLLLSHSFVLLLENIVCVQITPNTFFRHFQELQRQKPHNVYHQDW